MALVELTKITKRFGEQSVLNELALNCHDGEYLVVLGSSGCGKSTLLKIIAGLTTPDGGTVRLDGLDVTRQSPRKRNVSFLFQSDALYPHMTVRKSIESGIVHSFPPADRHRQIETAAEMVGVAPLLDRLPETLSGGERRRAALAKAIARGAKIRLLDEPLSAVDAHLTHRIQDDLLRWHRSCPGVSIHVTHDGQEALRMAERIAILHSGRIVQIDTPENVCNAPATIAAAETLFHQPLSVVTQPYRQPNDTDSTRTHVEFRLDDDSRQNHRKDSLIGFCADDAHIQSAERNEPSTNDVIKPNGDEPGIYIRGVAMNPRRIGNEIFVSLGLADCADRSNRIFVRVPSEDFTNKKHCWFVPESKLFWFENDG